MNNPNHLVFLRQLPCLVCGDNTSTEAAHIRYGDRSVDKPITGIGIKPDDRFAVPLCGPHHRDQHAYGNERQWWIEKDIDPIKIALVLFSITGDYERAARISAITAS